MSFSINNSWWMRRNFELFIANDLRVNGKAGARTLKRKRKFSRRSFGVRGEGGRSERGVMRGEWAGGSERGVVGREDREGRSGWGSRGPRVVM